MIEMRWFVKLNGVKVLQMRQQIDQTVYAGFPPPGQFVKHLVWSEWSDVPEVVDK